MKIVILIEQEDGSEFTARANSFGRAYDELAALERFVDSKKDKADVVAESLKEEAEQQAA